MRGEPARPVIGRKRAGRVKPSAPSQKQPAAVGRRRLGPDQHDLALGIRKAQRQNLGDERSDLPGREVDHRCHLPSDQRFRLIMPRDLRRGFLQAEVGPKSIISR